MTDLQPTSSQASSGTIYQTAVLTPDLISSLIMDDSPQILDNKFWQFLGVDIPVADIKEWDFKNILDFVDLEFINWLMNYPEELWESLAIVEYEDVNGKLVPKRYYNLIELWDSVRAKVYLKMCRAREGFTLKAVTESKTFIDERLRTMQHPLQPINADGTIKKKKRWGLF